MKKIVSNILSLLAFSAIASEVLVVNVKDPSGVPMPGVAVCVSTMNKIVALGSDSQSDYNLYYAMTDSNGVAKVEFRCLTASYTWFVPSSEAHYGSERVRETFRFQDMGFGQPILKEHSKTVNVVVWPRINPKPMFARGPFPSIHSPRKNGRFGFDMKKFDWLPPEGSGETADFYLVQSIGKIGKDGNYCGYIEFEDGCGAYIAQKTGCKNFPSTYCADTNAEYKAKFDFIEVGMTSGIPNVRRKYIANANEYMVLRTRVKKDAKGNIVEANYSKILGPMGVGCELEFNEMVFNPVVNSMNLELDSKNNYVKEFSSSGLAP